MTTTNTNNAVQAQAANAYLTKQAANALAVKFIKNAKAALDTSAALMVCLTYHVMQHGNVTLLNQVLNAVPNAQRKFMVKALLECKALVATKTVNNNGEQQHIKRNGGNRSAADADAIASLIPDWRSLLAAHTAELLAKRAANKVTKAASVKAEKVDEVISLAGETVGIVNVHADIQVLAMKINDLVKQNKVALADAALAASFVAWFQSNDNQTYEKSTGTHGK